MITFEQKTIENKQKTIENKQKIEKNELKVENKQKVEIENGTAMRKLEGENGIVKIYVYDRIVLKIQSLRKKLFLPYLLKVYLVLPDQNPQYARLLRKEGKTISVKGGEYKVLISKHNVSNASKLRVLDKILNIKYKDSTLFEEMVVKFTEGAIPKKDRNFKSIEYMLILDALSTFLISNNDNSDFLNDTLNRKQKRYEQFSYSEDVPYELIPNLIINNKGLYTKHISHSPKLQVRRWKKSKTYKLNRLLATLSKGYTAKWCYVNEINEFFFDGNKYKVEDEAYYKKKYGVYIYDQILVIQDKVNGKDKLHFYTMDIDKIDKNKILIPLQE